MLRLQEGRVNIFQSRIFQTNSTVIDLGESVLICDPSWFPDEIKAIKSFVDEYFPNHKKYLFITHFDFDHVWGWESFKDAFIIAPDISNFPEIQKKCLLDWHNWDSEHYITRDYPPRLPENIDFVLNSNCSLKIDEILVHFYSVPGHTADGFAAYLTGYKTLIAGDYLSTAEIPWIGTNSIEYRNSLLLFKELIEYEHPKIIIPGHGMPDETLITCLQNIEQALQYLHIFESKAEKDKEAVMQYISSFPFKKASLDIHDMNQRLTNLTGA